MALLGPGDKVHVVERRSFDGDVRRHFVGEVEAADEHAMRVTGYAFICNSMTGNFDRREQPRTRIFPVHEAGVVVYVIPRHVDPKTVRYEREAGDRLLVRAVGWEVYLDEFASPR